MRQAIEAQSGTIVSTEGDSVFAVLRSAREALAAAIGAQRGLDEHDWPEGLGVRVRIGIHVGEAVFGGRDYTGIDVHRTARVMAAAWGGEILVSAAVAGLVGESLPDGVTLRDLGAHALRDIPEHERLYQVVAPGLRLEFPPPRTESAAARNNLPTPLTRFVGRARELKEVEQLVVNARLVTLTGPGGTGKTRLAIEAGRASLATFSDGVFFVALDAVRDADLVVPQIAQTLGTDRGPVSAHRGCAGDVPFRQAPSAHPRQPRAGHQSGAANRRPARRRTNLCDPWLQPGATGCCRRDGLSRSAVVAALRARHAHVRGKSPPRNPSSCSSNVPERRGQASS